METLETLETPLKRKRNKEYLSFCLIRKDFEGSMSSNPCLSAITSTTYKRRPHVDTKNYWTIMRQRGC